MLTRMHRGAPHSLSHPPATCEMHDAHLGTLPFLQQLLLLLLLGQHTRSCCTLAQHRRGQGGGRAALQQQAAAATTVPATMQQRREEGRSWARAALPPALPRTDHRLPCSLEQLLSPLLQPQLQQLQQRDGCSLAHPQARGGEQLAIAAAVRCAGELLQLMHGCRQQRANAVAAASCCCCISCTRLLPRLPGRGEGGLGEVQHTSSARQAPLQHSAVVHGGPDPARRGAGGEHGGEGAPTSPRAQLHGACGASARVRGAGGGWLGAMARPAATASATFRRGVQPRMAHLAGLVHSKGGREGEGHSR